MLTDPEKMSREDLIEELIYLRKEAQMQLHDERIGALMADFGLTANEGRLVLALYVNRGPCSRERLSCATRRLDYAHVNTSNYIAAMTSHARRKLGAGSITPLVGIGYSLSEEARGKISAALDFHTPA